MPENTRLGYNSFEIPTFEAETDFTTTSNNFVAVLTRGVTRVDSATIIPITSARAADVRVQVAYERPADDTGDSLDATGLVWREFTEQGDVATADVPSTNKILIRPYDEGITAIRVLVRPSTNNQHATGKIYYRGVHLRP